MLGKFDLRKVYLEKRKMLEPTEIGSMSEKIAGWFAEWPLTGSEYIHIFYPIPGKYEVDSITIAQSLRNAYPAIKLVLPRINPLDHSLEHILWEESTQLAMNAWGITEPINGTEVNPEDISMVIIPLMAYDVSGNRVGYGKGFYDRFLEKCKPGMIKCGVSFFPPEEGIEDVNEQDIALNFCVTPDKTYSFNQTGPSSLHATSHHSLVP